MVSLHSYQLAGDLITVEGPDGTGKSTQIELLCERLRLEGKTVVVYDFPHKSGTPIGQLIGGFLKGQFGQVTPEFLALAFSVDRFEARAQLLADLNAGHTVVCDRYVRSNIAFQTAKIDTSQRRAALEVMLTWLEYDLFKLPSPALEIVLVADERYFFDGQHLNREADIQREYIGMDADIHEQAVGLQIDVNAYYSGLSAGPHLSKLSILDHLRNRLTIDELHQAIWTSVVRNLSLADET